jgi:hypothetical protein
VASQRAGKKFPLERRTRRQNQLKNKPKQTVEINLRPQLIEEERGEILIISSLRFVFLPPDLSITGNLFYNQNTISQSSSSGKKRDFGDVLPGHFLISIRIVHNAC